MLKLKTNVNPLGPGRIFAPRGREEEVVIFALNEEEEKVHTITNHNGILIVKEVVKRG